MSTGLHKQIVAKYRKKMTTIKINSFSVNTTVLDFLSGNSKIAINASLNHVK